MNLRDIWPTLGTSEPTGPRKNKHPTKSGPGRRHGEGEKHGTKDKPPRTGIGFVQHRASPAKKLRRANVEALGRRQAIKAAKRERREALPTGLAEAA